MAGPGARHDSQTQQRLRLDKWLWQARFFKSRGLACEAVEGGLCRVNGQRTAKPGYQVGIGDVLTFAQAGRIRVIRIVALGVRRGPAGEAQQLYDDLDAAGRNAASTALE